LKVIGSSSRADAYLLLTGGLLCHSASWSVDRGTSWSTINAGVVTALALVTVYAAVWTAFSLPRVGLLPFGKILTT